MENIIDDINSYFAMETKIRSYIKKNQFDELAKYLLFETHIVANDQTYRMLEIELYVCNDKHKDIFTHCHKEQGNMLTWYFHQMSEKEHSYKGGTFKGLDITCGGNGEGSEGNNKKNYGGILIRSIMNETTNDVIEGPCNVVNELLKQVKCNSIRELVIDKFNNNLSCIEHSLLKVEEKHYDADDMYVAPRIGLSMKGYNTDEKQNYVDKNYRYIVFKDKVKKEKKKMVKL